jgi:hypothetical protein
LTSEPNWMIPWRPSSSSSLWICGVEFDIENGRVHSNPGSKFSPAGGRLQKERLGVLRASWYTFQQEKGLAERE